MDALELPRDGSAVRCRRGFRVEYDEHRLAANHCFRPHAGATRKWPENGPLANPIRTGFLARGLAGGKLRAELVSTPACPPTTSRLCHFRAVPCGITRQDEAGALSCRLGRSAPELPSVSFVSSCWRPRAVARSTPCWCGDWIVGDARSPTCSALCGNWNI